MEKLLNLIILIILIIVLFMIIWILLIVDIILYLINGKFEITMKYLNLIKQKFHQVFG
ncbi:MAG: hypothetical protein GQ557_02625 [Mycoplasmataceae bacterium]|nr:hypothetical protein [Mycoplasmataceae bacterium]